MNNSKWTIHQKKKNPQTLALRRNRSTWGESINHSSCHICFYFEVYQRARSQRGFWGIGEGGGGPRRNINLPKCLPEHQRTGRRGKERLLAGFCFSFLKAADKGRLPTARGAEKGDSWRALSALRRDGPRGDLARVADKTSPKLIPGQTRRGCAPLCLPRGERVWASRQRHWQR